MKKVIAIPIYDVNVHIVIGHDPNKELDSLPFDVEDLPRGPALNGMTLWESGADYCVIYNTRYFNIEVFTHEIFHLTHRILERARINLTHDSSEPFAYLSGYLAKAIWPFVKKYVK